MLRTSGDIKLKICTCIIFNKIRSVYFNLTSFTQHPMFNVAQMTVKVLFKSVKLITVSKILKGVKYQTITITID